MLVDFSVENFGPFRDRVTLSLQATSRKEHLDNVIKCEPININLLSSALVFGPNASGKSHLFKAIRVLQKMVKDAFTDDTVYPWYEPFKLDQKSIRSPVFIQVRFYEEEILYEYSISFLSDRIVSEKLVYYPMKRAKTVFERKDSINEFKGKNKKLLTLLNATTPFLVLGSKYNDELCSKVRRMIHSIIALESQNISSLPIRSCKFVENDEAKTGMMISGLQKSDFGIIDYELVDYAVDKEDAKRHLSMEAYEKLFSDSRNSIKSFKIAVKHRYGSSSEGAPLEAVFDMDTEESIGTRYMFGIMGPLVDSLVNGKTLLIDEFGSHLHPLLTRWLVEQFSKKNNPNKAQLVVITHDVGLIDTRDLIRRDQVFFTDKNRDTGSSTLYCLSDFKGTRKDDQVLKAYLMGRYDAIPLVSSRGIMNAKND